MVKSIENLHEIYQNHSDKWQSYLEEYAKEIAKLSPSEKLKVSLPVPPVIGVVTSPPLKL